MKLRLLAIGFTLFGVGCNLSQVDGSSTTKDEVSTGEGGDYDPSSYGEGGPQAGDESDPYMSSSSGAPDERLGTVAANEGVDSDGPAAPASPTQTVAAGPNSRGKTLVIAVGNEAAGNGSAASTAALNALKANYADIVRAGGQVVVVPPTDAAAAANFAKAWEATWAGQPPLFTLGNASALPDTVGSQLTYFIQDQQGNPVYRFDGATSSDRPTVNVLLQKLLTGG